MDQLGLTIFGVTAIWLSQDKSERCRKYAPIFWLLSQPFWFYTAWINQQWGVLVLSIIYTVCWLKGVKTYWGVRQVVDRCGWCGNLKPDCSEYLGHLVCNGCQVQHKASKEAALKRLEGVK